MKNYIKIGLFFFFLVFWLFAGSYWTPDLMWIHDYCPDPADLDFTYGLFVGVLDAFVFSSLVAGLFALFDLVVSYLAKLCLSSGKKPDKNKNENEVSPDD